ncbi:MAG: UpxY family transcription antiterminator [Bacteroidetes bacterium]|nr:MAG: UpxY family transcription antiterminator [Bacteroidota bacterium]
MSTLTDYVNQLDVEEPRWFAVYTNYKREKLVHKLLDQKGIQNYLPLQKVTRRYARKIKTLELPLISCYIFVKIRKEEYVPVLETEHVLKFIRFSKNLIAIPESEIDIIRKVVGEGIEVEVEQTNRFEKGDEVEVVGGSLTGLRGKLIAAHGRKQFLVELDSMGYTLRMSIDGQLLQHVKNGKVIHVPA